MSKKKHDEKDMAKDESIGKEEVVELTKEEELQNKVDELTDMLQRKQAEFENFRKRTQKETSDFAKFACNDLIVELLEVMDNFSLALKHGVDEKGVEMIYAQLLSKLEKRGLSEVEVEGKSFDPNTSEALMTRSEDGKEDNAVLEVVTRGYKVHDKVVRHAKVIVNKKN